MDLKNNLYAETGWDIAENSFDEEQIVTTGSNFMIGNGYLGYRGTFAEWEAEAGRMGFRYVKDKASDNSKLREVLCWEPSISLEEGLATTYQWIEAQVQATASIPAPLVAHV